MFSAIISSSAMMYEELWTGFLNFVENTERTKNSTISEEQSNHSHKISKLIIENDFLYKFVLQLCTVV